MTPEQLFMANPWPFVVMTIAALGLIGWIFYLFFKD